jgi:phospholipase C
MSDTDRRTFLKLMGTGAFAAALPTSIVRALSVPAHNRTGTIDDVEHVIFFMQENRSFDHYFGTLWGVRGFADPHPVRLPSGQPVWNQPNGAGQLLPFRPDVPDLGKSFLPDPPHGWPDTHAAWNRGRHDQWVANKGVDTMSYHTRNDIPFQYALADAFTICDNYHCSLLGPTDPNRYHMWTGWVGNDAKAGGPVITNAEAGYDWSTYPERLQRNGISWKVYQDVGVGLTAEGSWGWTGDAPYIGNYGDNSLLYFHQYQNAPAGSPLANGAKVGTNAASGDDFFRIFRADVAAGNLPQVSWIVAPESYCEHPNWAPDFGAWYVSQFIEILVSNADLWSKTVLFLMYDEEGGFFDHMVPPTPPASSDLGASTVDVVNEIYPGSTGFVRGPYGLGMRVPLIVVSPWSRGGWVNSELFDHTSLIRFLEARFAGNGKRDLVESNITPWRRSVVGDLTSTFDFETPNAARVSLPDTSSFKPTDDKRHPDLDVVAPANQALPAQEQGVRPARPLPYKLDVHATVSPADDTVRIDFRNVGAAGVVFLARSANAADAPRTYTVEPHRSLTGTWKVTTPAYDLEVHGPNGFFRGFKGGVSGNAANLDVKTISRGSADEITLAVTNRSGRDATVQLLDRYTGQAATKRLGTGDTWVPDTSTKRLFGWYDVVVTVAEDPALQYRLAGHLEDGGDSMSDPGMGGLVQLHSA